MGSLLHLCNAPFTGTIMVGLNLLVYALARMRVPRFGAVIIMGVATSLVNAILSGGFKPGASISIMLEAVCIEAMLTFFGSGRGVLIGTGALLSLVAKLSSFLNMLIFFGWSAMVTGFGRLVESGPVGQYGTVGVLALGALAYLAAGAVMGEVAYRGVVFLGRIWERVEGESCSGTHLR